MSAPQVKICGLKTRSSLEAACAGNVRYVGFNFVSNSPRYIAPRDAASLRSLVPSTVSCVALVVDPGDAELEALLTLIRPDIIQLHGSETLARTSAIRERFSLPVIKACPIATSEDVEAALSYESIVDYLMFDAKAPKDSALSGGHGAAFDWNLLAQTRRPVKPWLLAGGLTITNIEEAYRKTGAPILDVASGVETKRGEKDPALITAFLDTARAL